MVGDIPCAMLIKQINDALEKQSNNDLRSQDLTMAQVIVLLRLNDLSEKQASLKELELFLRVAQSTAAGIITRLEQKAYVEGFSDASDKRIKLVRITKSGEQCCADAKKYMDSGEKSLLSCLDEEERSVFQKSLRRVSDNMK